MAAAEARTAWQRAANRCFVQEDAKRAPKLACCQSSSSPNKQEVETGPVSDADRLDHTCIGFMPFSRNPSYSNLPPDVKWWLQLQPTYGHQGGFTNEHLIALEAGMEKHDACNLNIDPKMGENNKGFNGLRNSEPSFDGQGKVSTKKQLDVVAEQLTVANDKIDQDTLELKDMTDFYDLMEMELGGSSASKRSGEISFGADSSWIGVEKVPWWRKADGDELASLVAQKSLNHVQNCDLPPPQKMRVRKERKRDSHDEISASSREWDAHSHDSSALFSGESPNSVATNMRHWAAVKEAQSKIAVSKPFLSTNYHDLTEKARVYDTDPGKVQLLEALCHSQTRAREAETAAKQAYAEKEHVVKLFLRQASHLFAYKQWFRLLQLESFYLQIKDADPATSPLGPILLPWMPFKPRKLRKNWQKSAKVKRRKRGQPRCDIGKYAVAFALGLSLVGAGLLLGWTVGWLFPTL